MYYEDTRQMLLSKGRCEVTEEETDSAVLADLQLVQDEDMQTCLPGLHSKVSKQLCHQFRLVKVETCTSQEGHVVVLDIKLRCRMLYIMHS